MGHLEDERAGNISVFSEVDEFVGNCTVQDQ